MLNHKIIIANHKLMSCKELINSKKRSVSKRKKVVKILKINPIPIGFKAFYLEVDFSENSNYNFFSCYPKRIVVL